MAIGLVGRKCGMTRVFTENGESIPVSVIEVEPNRVTQVKTVESDGYVAVQIAFGSSKPQRINKPATGHFAKASVAPGRGLKEFRVNPADVEKFPVGTELKVDIFAEGQKVDVTGTTIGKGFAGTVKRHHFATQDATHGNSVSHRAPGSIGQRQTPGRVFKGKRMSGHLGNKQRTVQNLTVVRIDAEKNLLLISGAIPGSEGGDVIVNSAVKARG